MFEEYTKNFFMDYDGQKRAETFFERLVILSSVIGLIVGYMYQHFSFTIISLGVGFVLSALISIPPWPMYRRHPLRWQKHDPSKIFVDYCQQENIDAGGAVPEQQQQQQQQQSNTGKRSKK